MKTFLINMADSRDRLQQSGAQLRQAAMPYERLEAVNGATLDQAEIPGLDQEKAEAIFTNPLRAGEIGCYLSHLRAVERIVELDLPYAMVLEDDFEFKPSSQAFLGEIERQLNADKIKNWDVINLGNAAKKVFRSITVLKTDQGRAQLCRAFYFPVTTTGLIWSRDGARRFLQSSGKIYEPIDGTLQRLMCASGRGLACRQSILTASGAESIISPISAPNVAMQDAGLGFRMGRYVDAMARFIRGPADI